MTWALWRGDDLLGELHARPPSQYRAPDPAHVAAVLVPDPAHLPLPSVRQYVSALLCGIVLEHARAPHVAGERPAVSEDSTPGQGFVVVTRDTPPPAGVPPARQLRVRDAAGRVLPTRYLSVLEFRPHPEHPPAELAALPAGVLVGGSVWLVDFMRADAAPAA